MLRLIIFRAITVLQSTILPTFYLVLQNQVATLLQVKSCHADASQIQRLTQALVQKEGEVKILNAKISSLEKQKVNTQLC